MGNRVEVGHSFGRCILCRRTPDDVDALPSYQEFMFVALLV